MNTNTDTLLKLLTEAGLGSRRKMADAIRNGRVKVNGVTAENFRQPIDARKDSIQVEGKPVQIKPPEIVYLMMNKPKNFLSTTADDEGRRTVMSILPAKFRHLRLYPIGRLDKDTTGLLILTNDGALTHEMTHPSFEHGKEYLLQIKEKLAVEDKHRLERGIRLEEGITRPAIIREVRSAPPYNYSIAIHEGKKRQIRRMFAILGHPVVELKRVRTGNLMLGNLREGEMRQLSPREIRALVER